MARQTRMTVVTGGKDAPIEEIETAAEVYGKAAAASQRARKKTADTRDALIALLEKHGRENYTAEDGKVYSVALGKKKIVITEKDGEPDDDSGESDE